MNILDRFSTHLRDILARSIHLAGELKNPLVEPIHLLFTLSNQKGSMATEILNRCKINPKTLEQAILSLPILSEVITPPAPNTVQNILTPLGAATKTALEKAMLIAQEHGHNYIGSEHLLAALARLPDTLVEDVFKVNAVKISELQKQLDTVFNNTSQFPHISEVAEVVERIQENMSDVMGTETAEPILEPKRNKKKESALDFFATNLTAKEIQKNIDPVVGREREIERVIQILSRRTKNNPLLLGDPGVGKTAIVEGLAKRIVEGKVPDILLNKKIYALDMGLLIAGTIYRGEFEGRLRQVIDEVIGNPNIILFIDEIHNIVGAGSNQGTMDAANILKPALSRGHIRCIGATTPAEYKKYIENDAALERRFQSIYTEQPSVEDTIAILNGIKGNYEAYHSVTITPEAVIAAARLSDRYISNKFLPDKAIDILDETAAAKRVSAKAPAIATKLWRLEQKLEKTIAAKESAATTDRFSEAVTLKKQEEELKAEIKKLEQLRAAKKTRSLGTITAEDIAAQVAKITGTPPAELLLENSSQLTSLGKELQRHIVGQDHVITEVAQLIRQAQLGLSHPERPLASFLFVGESGVGKTELAKTLARTLYHSPDALIKLDMSEFNEGFSVSKLLGSPAGYVGYKENNQFTDRVKTHPYCVVLFDEIDKAHKDIIKLLLQMLENGEITDSTGKHISLRHAIVILTTSFGAEEIKRGAIGFGNAAARPEETKKRLQEKLKEFFSPEVINRLDQVCLFNPLTPETLVQIAALELQKFNERLKQYHTTVTGDEKVLQWLVAQLPQKNSGARDVRRSLRHQVELLMADIILQNKVKGKYQLKVVNDALAVK